MRIIKEEDEKKGLLSTTGMKNCMVPKITPSRLVQAELITQLMTANKDTCTCRTYLCIQVCHRMRWPQVSGA